MRLRLLGEPFDVRGADRRSRPSPRRAACPARRSGCSARSSACASIRSYHRRRIAAALLGGLRRATPATRGRRPRSRAASPPAPNIGTVPIARRRWPGSTTGIVPPSSAPIHCAVDVAVLAQQRGILERGAGVRACRGPWRSSVGEPAIVMDRPSGARVRLRLRHAATTARTRARAPFGRRPAQRHQDHPAEHERRADQLQRVAPARRGGRRRSRW